MFGNISSKTFFPLFLYVMGFIAAGVILWLLTTTSAGRTLWDWLDLFLAPLVVGAAGLWFVRVYRKNQSRIALKEQRLQRYLEKDRQRQLTLENYYDRMTELLTGQDLESGERADFHPEIVRLARTLTLNTLRELDSRRNGLVVKFLREAGLLGAKNIVSLKKANLAGLQLEGIELGGVNLARADLKKANLQGANLTATNLEAADLSGANLENALLKESSLYRANLENGVLGRANFEIASMEGVTLTGADLTGAILERAKMEGADLAGARLRDANCNRTNLTSSNLEKADLSRANLEGALLTGANLTGATLKDAVLRGADLAGCKLRGADLWGVNLTRGNLARATLIRCDLRRAKLYGANLRNANLEEADLEEANIRGVELRGANLRGANLTGVRNWKKEQLWEATCSPTTVMPDGSLHREWIKRYEAELERLAPSAADAVPVVWANRTSPGKRDQESVTKIR